MANTGLPQNTAVNIAAGTTVIKAGLSRVFSLQVVVSGAVGFVCDAATSGVAGIGNAMLTVPAGAAAGTVYQWSGGHPMQFGITVIAGSGSVYAMSYS